MREAKTKSFYISLAYVGVGTLALWAMGNKTLNQIDVLALLIPIVNLLTLPVCFIGFGLLYGDGKEAWPTVLAVQLVVFILFWYFLYRYLANKYRRH